MTVPTDLSRHLEGLLGPFLARQRWFARSEDGVGPRAEILDHAVLREQHPALAWLLVRAGGADYQVLVGLRPAGDGLDFLSSHESGVLGHLQLDGECVAYDATLDSELCLHLLSIFTDGEERGRRARAVGAEQSNTSIVFDERLIAKVFRRVRPGPNPDVAVTLALDEVGFNHIAAPVGVWRRAGYDLAFVQQFLLGGSEGWALALTSLRDLYAAAGESDGAPGQAGDDARTADAEGGRPGEAGGDFAAEARRLGQVTARLHLAMAKAFGAAPGACDRWADSIGGQLVALEGSGLDEKAAAAVVERLRAVPDPGRETRVHGDYHLGQVMRTDTGWFVLDFEGEPARPVEERAEPRSPLKDVAGMLRSFQYAAAVALNERGESERTPSMYELGGRWEDHNREAFLAGYRETPGIDELVPGDDASFSAVLAAFELEKAVYELGYERAYRPDWVLIPQSALARLLADGGSGSA